MTKKMEEIENYITQSDFYNEKKGVWSKTYSKGAVKFRICSKGIYININNQHGITCTVCSAGPPHAGWNWWNTKCGVCISLLLFQRFFLFLKRSCAFIQAVKRERVLLELKGEYLVQVDIHSSAILSGFKCDYSITFEIGRSSPIVLPFLYRLLTHLANLRQSNFV